MKRPWTYWNILQAAYPRLCLCLALLIGLWQTPHALADVAIVDDRGQEVRLSRPAQRIVPLYGGLTDILLALGLEERIIARTAADETPQVATLVSVGTHMRPNVELLVGLGPDLVLQMGGRKEAMLPLEAAERQGIATAFFQARDFAELFSVIERIAVLAGDRTRGQRLVRNMRRRLQRVREKVAHLPRPSVFFEVRYPNLLAAGAHSMVDAVITAAGGRNAVQSEDKLVRLNEEALLALDPQVCLCQQGPMNPDPQPLNRRSHFRTLACVEEGRWRVVDERLFSRPGPGSVTAVERLAALLHPEHFAAREGQ